MKGWHFSWIMTYFMSVGIFCLALYNMCVYLLLLFVVLFKDALINLMVRRLPTTLQALPPTLVQHLNGNSSQVRRFIYRHRTVFSYLNIGMLWFRTVELRDDFLCEKMRFFQFPAYFEFFRFSVHLCVFCRLSHILALNVVLGAYIYITWNCQILYNIAFESFTIFPNLATNFSKFSKFF